VMNDWLLNPAREDIMEQFESQPLWDASHFDGHWHQVPVPQLELLMASRHELSSSNITNDHELDNFPLVCPGELRPEPEAEPRIDKSLMKVVDALGDAPLPEEEVVNVDVEHCVLETVNKPLLVVHFFSNNLPVDSVLISAAILPILVSTEELGQLEVLVPIG
jgi:hypothetical protein